MIGRMLGVTRRASVCRTDARKIMVELAADLMVKAQVVGDLRTLPAGKHHDGLLKFVALTHTGMTTDEIKSRVEAWQSVV